MKLPDKMLAHPEIYFRTNKLGELYFRFIKGTPLAELGWTGELLGKQLEAWGLIRIVVTQPQDEWGRYMKGQRVYYGLPGKRINRKEVVALFLAQCPKPPLSLLQRLFR